MSHVAGLPGRAAAVLDEEERAPRARSPSRGAPDTAIRGQRLAIIRLAWKNVDDSRRSGAFVQSAEYGPAPALTI